MTSFKQSATMLVNSTQPEPLLGLRGKSSLGASENIDPNCTTLGQKSSHLCGIRANNGQKHTGTTFGMDITNIVGATGVLKPAKQLPRLQQPTGAPQEVNAQAADQYANDIRDQLFQDEASFMPRSDCIEMQEDLSPKMRMILLDWLIEVHMKYKFRSETLHLAVNLIDRHLTRAQVARKQLQLVGVVAMWIAAKFEEISPPELHDWVYITDNAYTKADVLKMEVTMLTILSFKIVVPTAAHFFPIFAKANGCNDVHCELAQYIIELGLLEVRMLQYTPSHVVSAALLLSNELLGRSPLWPHHMVQQSRHAETSLRSCVDLMRQLFDEDRAGGSGLQAVHKKFCLKEHHSVATMTL